MIMIFILSVYSKLLFTAFNNGTFCLKTNFQNYVHVILQFSFTNNQASASSTRILLRSTFSP